MKNLFVLSVLVPTLLAGSTVTTELAFSPAELEFSTWQGYDVIDLSRGIVIPDPGKPCLPIVPVTLVVPADCRVTGVDVAASVPLVVARDANIVPSQPARPLSAVGPAAFVLPDAAAYSRPFPASPIAHWRTGRAAGYQLVCVGVCPLEYRPDGRELLLHTLLTVTVTCEDHAGEVRALTPEQQEHTAGTLAALVANPHDLSRFAPPSAVFDQQAVDYLVITGEQLAADFEPFADYQASRGLATAIRTVEWASRNYPGRDLQEQVRNLIGDYFEHRGTSYVLLAGDNSVVPARRIRVAVGNEQGDIPTDLYYSDLDYSWDSNHNGLFGEMSDSVDLYADVTLGRASVDNSTEVQTFITKARKYGSDPATDYIKRSLLPSGWLWRSINYHGRIVNDSIANRTPVGWTDVRLENPAGAQVVADSFDHGFAIFDPAGHGNENGVYDENGTAFYTSGLARAQHNDRRYPVTTSLACTPGNFEAEDCLAEHSHNAPDGGSIAVMMNSRYGWGTPPSFGPSEKLCVRFFDFCLTRNVTEIGACHARSCEEYAGAALYDELWRWCITEFNLFAEPSLDFWTDAPQALTLTVPDSVPTGSQSVTVTVRRGGAPAAGVRVAAWKPDECLARATSDASGQARLDLHPVTTGAVLFTAVGHNCLPAQDTVPVYLAVTEPLLTVRGLRVDDAGQPWPNGILEPGETGRIWLRIANAGTAGATGVTGRLRSLAGKLVVLDSADEYGAVAAGDSSEGSGYLVALAPDIKPGSRPELACLATAAEGTWDLEAALPVGYPGRTSAELDTGVCALSVTARGSIGFDPVNGHSGRGFRFPKTDTSSLNAASFCLAGPGSCADRFYSVTNGSLDADWTLAESLRALYPPWGSHQALLAAFTDAGLPGGGGIRVTQHALASADSTARDFTVLIFDVRNSGPEPRNGLYAGVLADFDVKATDRFHDLAFTSGEEHTAWMTSSNILGRVVGVCHLAPDVPANARAIDHSVYVYPDSGLSDDMKYRLLAGAAGTSGSNRPFNWSVSVGAGPFDLAPDSSLRVAFAFAAGTDSASYLDACRRARDWYRGHVGIAGRRLSSAPPTGLVCHPDPFRQTLTINLNGKLAGLLHITAYDAAGRRVAVLHSGPAPQDGRLHWSAAGLAGGVYLLRFEANGLEAWRRVTLAR